MKQKASVRRTHKKEIYVTLVTKYSWSAMGRCRSLSRLTTCNLTIESLILRKWLVLLVDQRQFPTENGYHNSDKNGRETCIEICCTFEWVPFFH